MAANLATQLVANYIAQNAPQIRADLLAVLAAINIEREIPFNIEYEVIGAIYDRPELMARLIDLYRALGG